MAATIGCERDGWMAAGARLARAAAALMLAATLSACAFGASETVVEEPAPPEELMARADALFAEERWAAAATAYGEVERLHPASTLVKRAMIRSAESSYRDYNYDQTVVTATRFLEFYPSDERAPYAQYMIAMSFYNQITDVDRDQSVTRQALQQLRTLINRYPNSEYAREGQLKLDLTVDHLAGQEMTVGRYYLRRRQYVGAINRFRTVVERYQSTTHVAEALHRLVEAYLALGVINEAQTAAAVLGHNFPGSEWYQYSFAMLNGQDIEIVEDERSWISRAWGVVRDTPLF